MTRDYTRKTSSDESEGLRSVSSFTKLAVSGILIPVTSRPDDVVAQCFGGDGLD